MHDSSVKMYASRDAQDRHTRTHHAAAEGAKVNIRVPFWRGGKRAPHGAQNGWGHVLKPTKKPAKIGSSRSKKRGTRHDAAIARKLVFLLDVIFVFIQCRARSRGTSGSFCKRPGGYAWASCEARQITAY